MKVNTFIIGVQKAGTTSLYEWLLQHPQVCGEIFLKDYPFFIDSKLYEQGSHILENRFNCLNEPVVISGCVDYIEDFDSLKRIKSYNPDAKVILILRKAESRIQSAHTFLRQLAKEEHEDINEAIENDEEYLNRSIYAKKVAQLHDLFKSSQIKIILFEKLVAKPSAVLEEVFEFLTIEQTTEIKIFNANKTAEPRFKVINKIVFDKESNLVLRSIVKKVFPPKLRLQIQRFIKNTNTKKRASSNKKQTLNEKYIEAFKKDREALKKYIDVETYW